MRARVCAVHSMVEAYKKNTLSEFPVVQTPEQTENRFPLVTDVAKLANYWKLQTAAGNGKRIFPGQPFYLTKRYVLTDSIVVLVALQVLPLLTSFHYCQCMMHSTRPRPVRHARSPKYAPDAGYLCPGVAWHTR